MTDKDPKMPVNSLWGELPTDEDFNSPRKILNEQAVILSAQTNNVLQGRVKTHTDADEIISELSVVAPFLNNYEVTIIRIRHSAMMFPLKLHNLLKSTSYYDYTECKTLEEFIEGLGSILHSDQVHKIILSLRTQSKK